MSTAQVFEILTVIALIVAIACGVGMALVYVRLQRYQRNQHVILGSRGTVDIVEHVSSMDDKLANMRLALEDLTLAARDHDVRIDTCLSRVGIVRFDAYQDLGGRQSTAVALLDSTGDGVVITTVVSRDFARMYVKLLRKGTPDIPLAPEEIEAVEQAKGSAPFVIRPRSAEQVPTQDNPDGLASLAPDEPLALGIPGRRPQSDRELARENRKRKRQGLPPLEEGLVRSAIGWEESRTPSPLPDNAAAPSLAGQYISRQKRLRERTAEDKESLAQAGSIGENRKDRDEL